MLVLTTVAALVAMVAVIARRGSILAQATVIVMLALATFFMLSASLVLLASFCARYRRRSQGIKGESPFAEHRPPPRLVHPEEPV